MGKFSGILLASDFDNTLLNTTLEPVPEISAGNKKALRYFMDNGGRFAIATGRALPAFEKFVPQVPMNAPGVICNGAALYDFTAGQYLDTVLLDGRARKLGQDLLDRYPELAAEAYHIDNIIHVVRPNATTRRHVHVTHVAVDELPSLLEVPMPLGKLMFEGERPLLETVKADMDRQPWAKDYEIFFSADTLLELTAKGASKGDMVRRLSKRLGCRWVYCAGDESNDLSMLLAADEGFAPANCAEAVKQSGVTLVRDVDHDALANIVEILDQRFPG